MLPHFEVGSWKKKDLVRYKLQDHCGFFFLTHLNLKLLMQISTDNAIPGRRRPGVSRVKKHNVRTDMTPMVDLGFLLIAFFIMTTELSKPSVVKLNMPVENGPPTLTGESTTLTVLLGNEKLYCYWGSWENAIRNNRVQETSFSEMEGLGKIIRERQAFLDKAQISKEGRSALMLLIKAGPDASYGRVIDALDETTINNVKRYALVKPSEEELKYMN